MRSSGLRKSPAVDVAADAAAAAVAAVAADAVVAVSAVAAAVVAAAVVVAFVAADSYAVYANDNCTLEEEISFS